MEKNKIRFKRIRCESIYVAKNLNSSLLVCGKHFKTFLQAKSVRYHSKLECFVAFTTRIIFAGKAGAYPERQVPGRNYFRKVVS
jgi:hypothetical protein